MRRSAVYLAMLEASVKRAEGRAANDTQYIVTIEQLLRKVLDKLDESEDVTIEELKVVS